MTPSVRQKIGRLFSRRPTLSEHTVEHVKIDEAVLTDWRKRAPALEQAFTDAPLVRSTVNDGEDENLDAKVWERLAGDVFFEYFGQREPTVLDEDKIAPEYHINRGVADKHSRTDALVGRRPMTRGEPFEASLATIAALDKLRDSYQNELREHGQRQNDLADHHQSLDEIDAAMEALRKEREKAPPEAVEQIDEQMRVLGSAKRDTSAALAALVREQDATAVQIGAATLQAAQKAASAADSALEAAGRMIGKDPGQATRLSPEAMFALADRYATSPILRAVADMLGRIKLGMGTMRRTMRKGGNEEMVDIETGREWEVVLPQEKVLLRHPVARLDFYRRFQESALMQYEMWSEQELKRGPAIVVVDGSDSMRGARNIWARGAALATIGIMNTEGRNCAGIEFGDPGQYRTFTFPKEHALDPLVCADFAEHFFSSGTSILTGLTEAKRLIDNEAPFHAADIVVITDGFDHWTETDATLVAELRDMGVKIHGVMIGAAAGEYMTNACDEVTCIADIDLSGRNAATDNIAIHLS